MANDNLKQKTLSGLFWKFGEKITAHLVTFIVSIVLARLLEPKAYGAIALITVFIKIANVFVDSGLGSALVQRKDAGDLEFSTVFYFNMLFSSVLYFIIFLIAPFVADFYGLPELCLALRLLGVSVLIYGVKGVQQAYVAKNMIFKKFFFSTIGGTIASAVVGIAMAYYGFGVYALVGQYISNALIDTIVLWLTVKWRPKKMFSFGKLKSLFSFGWRILVSSLIDTVYNNVRQLIIGKLYTKESLAFYNKGKSFPVVIVDNVNTAIDNVLLPSMSTVQDDKERLKNLTRRSIKTSSYIMCVLMAGIAVCAKPLVILLLTEKWLDSVIYLQIFCFTYMFRPVHTANLNAIKALGRSDLYLKLEIIKKVFGIAVLIATMWFGPLVMAASFLVTTPINAFINASPNKKLLGYGYIDQIKDFLPSLVLSLIMCVPVYLISLINMPVIAILIVQAIVGAVTYIGLSVLFKFDSFIYLAETFNPKMPKFVQSFLNVLLKLAKRTK